VLLTCDEQAARALEADCVDALSEDGAGFRVRSSHGSVRLPEEAATPSAALRLVDERMCSSKDRPALVGQAAGPRPRPARAVGAASRPARSREQRRGARPRRRDQARARGRRAYDGGGYPDGLAGDAIPLASRIVFVCDAFDAMTSTRPYKAAIGEAAALTELRRGAGSQFDAIVVETFGAELAAVRDRLPSGGARAAA